MIARKTEPVPVLSGLVKTMSVDSRCSFFASTCQPSLGKFDFRWHDILLANRNPVATAAICCATTA